MMKRSLLFFLLLFLLPACAMQRATDAEKARTFIRGMNKTQIFACMGIPSRKGRQDDLEIWLYKSGNDHKETSRTQSKLSMDHDTGIFEDFGTDLTMREETSQKRFCIIQIVMKNDIVQSVNYTGPSGGWLTQDEQCAFATRNCLP